MKTIKLASKSLAIATFLLASSAVQATVTPTTTVDVLWQWLFPTATQSALKICPRYPRCENVEVPKPESSSEE